MSAEPHHISVRPGHPRLPEPLFIPGCAQRVRRGLATANGRASSCFLLRVHMPGEAGHHRLQTTQVPVEHVAPRSFLRGKRGHVRESGLCTA